MICSAQCKYISFKDVGAGFKHFFDNFVCFLAKWEKFLYTFEQSTCIGNRFQLLATETNKSFVVPCIYIFSKENHL